MSTPKEKALELYQKYIGTEGSLHIQLKLTGFTEVKRKGKKHSLIAVNEILDQLDEIINITGGNYIYTILDYWQEVEQEIGKL
jgi:hypothetical protein